MPDPRHHAGTTPAAHWRDTVDWWTDPRLAYAAGLADGAASERARIAADADAGQRAAARRAGTTIQAANARARADRPGPRDGDYPGRQHTPTEARQRPGDQPGRAA